MNYKATIGGKPAHEVMGMTEEQFAIFMHNADSDRELFMKQYKLKHECCPNCGSITYGTTFIAYIYNSIDPDSYHDYNRADCKCGFKHRVDDRISEELWSNKNV